MSNLLQVEWLCLNCQVQRALGASEPPGTPKMNLQTVPNKAASAQKKETPSQQKDISITGKSKEVSPLGSPQRKPSNPAELPAKGEVDKESGSSDASQKIPQQGQKTGPQKPSDQTSKTGPEKKPRSDSANAAESLGGKMFGFGSSIFSTASTMITSAVQDESKTMPPVSPKMPVAKGTTKSPPVQKHEQEKKPLQSQQPKTSPMLQPKVEKGPQEPLKDPVPSAAPKAGQSTCMLCKTALNFGSKDPPNYNKCTECKNTVCNQCGFNPMPNVSEVITNTFFHFQSFLNQLRMVHTILAAVQCL